MIKRILISTGGSGGHVVPATILYEHLKKQFHVSMSSDDRGIKFLDKNKYAERIEKITDIPSYALFAKDYIQFKNNQLRVCPGRWTQSCKDTGCKK